MIKYVFHIRKKQRHISAVLPLRPISPFAYHCLDSGSRISLVSKCQISNVWFASDLVRSPNDMSSHEVAQL